jgi:Rod binding domain-containing protein
MLSAANAAALLAQDSEANVRQATTFAQLKAGSKSRKMTDAQMNAVAKDFEAVFLSQMFGSMFGDSTGDSLFGNAESKEVYKSMLMSEYGKSVASLGGIGIASHVKSEMLRMQEMTP